MGRQSTGGQRLDSFVVRLGVVGNFVLATGQVHVNSFVFVVIGNAAIEWEPGSGRQRLATHIQRLARANVGRQSTGGPR